MKAAIDNDVLLKCACYDLLSEMCEAIPSGPEGVGALGAARFVIRDAIRKVGIRIGATEVVERLGSFLSSVEVIEPSSDEVRLAAELEYLAQRELLPLDPGESQLCAVVVTRFVPVMITGDKRAIKSLEVLLEKNTRLRSLARKVLCMEQLVARMVRAGGEGCIRKKICAEPVVDKALSLSFSCSSLTIAAGSCAEGLISYVRNLRGDAGNVLADE
jgi:hypothetical protein